MEFTFHISTLILMGLGCFLGGAWAQWNIINNVN